MFSASVKSVNGSQDASVSTSASSVNKVAPGFSRGGSWWERLTGQK